MMTQPLNFFLWRTFILLSFILILAFLLFNHYIILSLIFLSTICVALLFGSMVFSPFVMWVNLFIVAFKQLKAPKHTSSVMKYLSEYTEVHFLGQFKSIPMAFEEKLFSSLKENPNKKINIMDENDFFIISKNYFSLIKKNTLNKMSQKLRRYLYTTLFFIILINVLIVYFGSSSALILFRNNSYEIVSNEMSLIDSIYFVFTILSTTGFGDISPINDLGKMFVITFYLTMIVIVTGIVTFFTNILQERLDELTYPMESFIEELSITQKELNADIELGLLIKNIPLYKKKFAHNKKVVDILDSLKLSNPL